MARFSELATRLNSDASAAWAVHDHALARRRQGDDVVLLSIGDPDFRTPDPIIDNAVSHMRVGRTHYSPALGELNLRRAVADYENRVSDHGCQIDEVAIFPGVTAALYAVMSCLLNPGDEIVIVDPQYVGYPPIMQGLQVRVNVVQAKPQDAFIPTIEALTAAVTDDTRVMLLNTPANPTGAIIPREVLRDLAAWAQQRDIWLVCDEVYSMLTYDKPHISLRTAAQKLDNLIVVDGLSKSHAMSGWRVGWVVGPPDLVAHLGRFSAMSIFGCPQFIQDASAFALSNDEYYVAEMREVYRSRRDAVCAALDKVSRIGYIRPEAGMFVMLDVTRVTNNDTLFAECLLEECAVSVLPGSAFGESTCGHARLSLVQPENVLLEGVRRIAAFTDKGCPQPL